jgi:hypothetical protein
MGPFYNSENNGFIPLTIETTDVEFGLLIKQLDILKSNYEKEQEETRKQNEILKKDIEKKEKDAEIEREKNRKEKEVADKLIKEKQDEIDAANKLIESEQKAKADAELKAKKEAEIAAKAPIKQQLNIWVDSFKLPETSIKHEKQLLIAEKFEAFKNWSKIEIEKL